MIIAMKNYTFSHPTASQDTDPFICGMVLFELFYGFRTSGGRVNF